MFIRVANEAKQQFESVEIPIDNGSVSLTTLAVHFPGVSALKYRHSETNTWRSVRVVDDKLYHPDGIWDPNVIYITVYSKQNTDEDEEQQRRQEEESIDENDPNRRCVDLIVLGISYRSIEADVKKCFEAFGELIFCEIKRDAKGQSRGFGFIRFKNYESQLAVINKRHFIDGRHVDVKIPDSKTNIQEPECARKIFVARLPDNITPDDLRQYFSKYAAIKDVYIPKPARSFAFVTFHDSNIVRTLFGTHTINGCSVTVGPAEPKTKSSSMMDYSSSNYKRVKPDHSTLRTLTPYGVSSTYSVYGHSPNADMIHPYYQHYNINPVDSSRAVFSDNQQTYWGNTPDERTAAIWQQQYYQ